MAESVDPRYKEAVIRALEYHFPKAKIILFGSRARGTHESGADIDIAIDIGKQLKLREEEAKATQHEGLILAAEDSIIQRFEYCYDSFLEVL